MGVGEGGEGEQEVGRIRSERLGALCGGLPDPTKLSGTKPVPLCFFQLPFPHRSVGGGKTGRVTFAVPSSRVIQNEEKEAVDVKAYP